MVAERGLRFLKALIQHVARADVPVPYSVPLESFVMSDPVGAERKYLKGRFRITETACDSGEDEGIFPLIL
jgi:pyruvate/2-oxoglutarate/acetoin dehydrogenase E1 component